MNFTKITIATREQDIELLTSELTDLGAEGFEIGGGSDLWDIIDSAAPDMIDARLFNERNAPITVTVYIPDNGQGKRIVEATEAFLHAQGLEYSRDEVNEEDWENNWKQYFKPIDIGGIIIKPSWERYDNTDGKPILEIDPASAFGTGQHATTRMCLESLCGVMRYHESVLDIGCGSGILSAAAGLLGAKSVTAVDICENAVNITKETLKNNGVENYSVYCGNVITDEALREKIGGNYDLVVANITADVIIAMAHLFAEFTSGSLLLSGIIEHRYQEVCEAINPYFKIVSDEESEGWRSIYCGNLRKPVSCNRRDENFVRRGDFSANIL
ncbi:MAG: 50S ribosomal protein L11 methyltransferase [Oscillospiraceae bacterium]|nr:50S ribosomal protein L11 methyltransferase [Oscillospiraceae bacterium]